MARTGGLRERILDLLSRMQGRDIPQSHLYRALNASKSRVSEILKELEENGLIERRSIGRSKIIRVKKGIIHRRTSDEQRVPRIGIVYSSEYLFLGYFIDKAAEKGYIVKPVVFKDGLEATRSLAEGELELVLSPLVGQLYLYPFYRSYRIIAGGMTGGFKILSSTSGSNHKGVIYSSRLSTMDYIRAEYLNRAGLKGAVETRYFSSPDFVEGLRRVDGYIVIWHPLYRVLEERGFRDLTNEAGIEISNCCTLAASNTLSEDVVLDIKDIYLRALDEYVGNPYRYLEYYSAITGIPLTVLKDAVGKYTVAPEVDVGMVKDVVSRLSNGVPDYSLYSEAFKLHQ